MTEAQLIQATSEELASVVGALLDRPGTAETLSGAVRPHWTVGLTFGGPSSGTVLVGFDRDGAQTLARLVMALDEDAPEAAVADTLQEVCGQALSAVCQRPGFEGLRMVETRMASAPPASEPSMVTISAGDRLSTAVAFWANVETVRAAAPAPSPAPAAAAVSAPAAVPSPVNLELILDIELQLTVQFGETEMTLHSLTRMAPGSVIDLGRSPDDPVDVLVNGRLIARGEVVVVSGNYGVRIVEVISPADRLKTVAA